MKLHSQSISQGSDQAKPASATHQAAVTHAALVAQCAKRVYPLRSQG
ncbi:MAG: hypothetical protein PHQ58_15435 [Rhodoferax sp.]|nr:hypothetical protein [Rhodoferax sp.]MDD2881819.1 hypothetical protein [Rhodoferax sp.]